MVRETFRELRLWLKRWRESIARAGGRFAGHAIADGLSWMRSTIARS